MKRKLVSAVAAAAALTMILTAAAGMAAEKRRPVPASASPAARALGNDGAWSAYVAEDHTGRVCYLVGTPAKSLPPSPRRKPSAMVTHRPAEKVFNVVSFVEGAPLKNGSTATLDIGPRKFDLFTDGDVAWSRTSDLDREIVETLAKGHDAVFHATPQHGPPTIDTYSLVGFTKVLGMIDKACGVRR